MNGKRYSRQRELIYEALMHTEEHPTAEMLYSWLKPDNPSLSLGTVYRNLNLLADEGIITRMAFPVERYDGNTTPHSHFCCDRCGRVYDIAVPYSESLDQEALKRSEHQIDRHEVLFRGVCAACKASR